MKTILSHLDIPQVATAIQAMFEGGLTRDAIIDHLAEVADGLIPAHLAPAPWGVILEKADGAVLRLLIRVVVVRVEKRMAKAGK
jgi:hypothetical protein